MKSRARDVALRHPRHLALAALVAGLLCGAHGPGGIAAGIVATGVVGVVLRPRRAVAAGLVVAVAAGGAAAVLRVAALAPQDPAPAGGRAVDGDVTLTDPVRTGAGGARTGLVALDGAPVLLRLPRGPARPAAGPPVGTVLRVAGELRPPDRHARLLRAHAVLHARTVAVTGRRRGGWAGGVDAARDRAGRALAAPLRTPDAALLRGMVLGDDSALPVTTREALRDAGLSHLVAASGQNVLLLCTLVLGLGAVVGAPWRARLLGALALVAVYVPLAGGGPSIQRAGVMGAAGLVAALAGRPSSRWYAVLLAAAATLALDPRAAGDAGWRLSFAAVLGILALAPRLRDDLVAARLPRPLAEVTAMTVAATLATAPVLAATFGETSAAALPANVLAAPLVAPVMWVGFVAAAVGQVAPAAGRELAALTALPLAGILAIGRHAAALPAATLAAPPVAVTAVCALACAAIAVPRTRAVAGAAGLAVVAAALALAPSPRPVLATPAGVRVSFLDVGQGDATLLQDGPHAALIDTGPPGGPILERLREAGVHRLDLLVLTHAQDDHLGAAATLLRRLPVGVVLDGRDGVPSATGAAAARAAAARGVRLVAPRAGQVLRLGRLRLDVRSPAPADGPPDPGADPNDRAIVLEARAPGGTRLLLPADAESPVLAGLGLGAVDVLKVAHHGSEDPGLGPLLAVLRPRLAVVSAGAGNRHGHPRAGTLGALRASGVQVLRTDRDGTVVLDLHGPVLRVRRRP